MTAATALLDAGAVLPAGTPVSGDDTVDTVTARSYRHPVLGERCVVRLVPATVGAAEDLTMEFLGFARDERVVDIGQVRQQALGFPAWALVHDPANGHHALALVKEVERLARVAQSRIGPARDGFTELGERLARSVPHFLPTFYEQAGRAFLVAGSATYAATMFGKAREAERVYALEIDEERQHTVFLEFALAGALTAKATSAHARELAARCEPAVAYERFRRLCVERTLGGLPPYAGMHTDLRRLARAAGLAAGGADEGVLRDLLPAPALVRAPAPFWTAYRAPLARLAAGDPVLRGRLLGMIPEHCPGEVWLAVLSDAGALAALTEPAATVPAGAGSPDGPAGWLKRFDQHREGSYWERLKRRPKLLELVERMAARLIADGEPVELCRRHEDVNMDLLDACLALGVPVAYPGKGTRMHVNRWLRDDTPGRRDLTALAADDRFRRALCNGVEAQLESGEKERAPAVRALLAVPGLRTALGYWLDDLADTVVRQGLPALGNQLDRVAKAACPEGFAVNPAAVRRVVGHDLGPLLGRTLRAGVLDEYGWPALEEAAGRLAGVGGKRHDDEVNQLVQWPHLVLRRGDLILVVGADGIAVEHLMRIPKTERGYMWSLVLRYVDGQLLVCWDRGRERAGYWTGAPDDIFTTPDGAFATYHGDASIPLPGGGRTAGGRPLHAGDRAERYEGPVASDGTAYWVLDKADDRTAWREYDPATGQQGRVSLPAFFAAGAVDGESLLQPACTLRPADAGAAAGPLGWRDGLVGWRVRRTADGRHTGAAVDGRSFALAEPPRDHQNRHAALVGAVRFPGSDTTYGVLSSSGWRESHLTLCTADGLVIGRYNVGERKPTFAKGTRFVPPVALWHHLRPRDPAGSAALRALTDPRAAELLSGAAGLSGADVRDLVARSVPEISDPLLGVGVAGVVRSAAKHAGRLREFAAVLETAAGIGAAGAAEAAAGAADAAGAARAASDADADTDEQEADPVGPYHPDDLHAALDGLITHCWGTGRGGLRLVKQAGAALTAPVVRAKPIKLPSADHDWLDMLGLLPAAMYRAAAPATSPPQREALLTMLDGCARSGLVAAGSRVRRVDLTADGKARHVPGDVVELKGRRLLVLTVDREDKTVTALEYAPDGRFGPVPGYRITGEQVMSPGSATPDAIGSFVRLVRDNGPIASPVALAGPLSGAAGMSHAEAVLLLAALPSERRAGAGEADGGLGLPATVANLARTTWQRRPLRERVELLGLMLPDDPTQLWAAGPRVEPVAAWWTDRHGPRVPVDDELILAADRAGVGEIPTSELLHGIANPETCRWLAGRVDGHDADDVLVSLARALPWLAYHLPARHPIRAALPVAAERARGLLRSRDFTVPVGYLDESKVDRFAAALGAPARAGAGGGVEIGPFRLPPDTGWRVVEVCPALLTGADDPALGVLAAQLDSAYDSVGPAIRALLGDQIATLVTADPGAVEDADCAQDPSRSAPALVAEVAGALGVGPDAATIYLQLLALPDPTDRNVARWTQWRPARLKAARAELAATDHVVTAKRARAGRSIFLPGGWLALKAPHLPLERWKIALLVGDEGGVSDLGIVIPVAPPPRLFGLAWDRVRAGDGPRFDELVTDRRR
jgi:hypothetical protein